MDVDVQVIIGTLLPLVITAMVVGTVLEVSHTNDSVPALAVFGSMAAAKKMLKQPSLHANDAEE